MNSETGGNSVLQSFPISRSATDEIDSLIMKGLSRIKYDRDDESRALEAEENYRYFADELLKRVQGNKSIIDVSDVKSILTFLCPLYPLC
jgi:hypothetical protein